jgi:SAM-dependent methyltransferase
MEALEIGKVSEAYRKHVSSLNLREALERDYGYNEDPFYVEHTITRICEILGTNLKRKRILDLGCGSTGQSQDSHMMGRNDGHFYNEPWLSRALYHLGARPIGVDIGRLVDEKFEHHSIDLLEPDALRFLKDHSVHLAIASRLFSSPQFNRLGGIETEFRKILDPQLERVLKPSGVFLYQD